MKSLLAALLFFPVTLLAQDLQFKVGIKSSQLNRLIQANTYGKGGAREGYLFADLMQSAPEVKRDEIDERFDDYVFPYQISEYFMSEAISAATAAKDMGIVAELQALQNEFGKTTPDGERIMLGKVYKERFIGILHKQFDQRVEKLVDELTVRLERHNGNYTSMLQEYSADLNDLENARIVENIKKFFSYLGIATVFFSIPLFL